MTNDVHNFNAFLSETERMRFGLASGSSEPPEPLKLFASFSFDFFMEYLQWSTELGDFYSWHGFFFLIAAFQPSSGLSLSCSFCTAWHCEASIFLSLASRSYRKWRKWARNSLALTFFFGGRSLSMIFDSVAIQSQVYLAISDMSCIFTAPNIIH
jgi:hypothetical protein